MIDIKSAEGVVIHISARKHVWGHELFAFYVFFELFILSALIANLGPDKLRLDGVFWEENCNFMRWWSSEKKRLVLLAEDLVELPVGFLADSRAIRR
jgi:hypothetical protein